MKKYLIPWVAVSAAPLVICAVFSLMSSIAAAEESGSDNLRDVCLSTAAHKADPAHFPCAGDTGDEDAANKNNKNKKKSSGGGADGPKYPCTGYGDQEKAIALQALQAGHNICQVATLLNSAQPPEYKSLAGDTECVCYPDGPYVGCREFYMAGPDDGSFTPDNYQSKPELWFSVSRCDPSCTDPKGCMP